MAEFRRQVGRRVLRARCADALAAQAEWLLGVVASFDGRGKGLADGVSIQLGWSLLRLRQDGSELAVCEPDFAANPFEQVRDDVTRPLTVQTRQNAVLARLGIEGTPVRFDDKVIAKKGCLAEPRVYAQRQEPDDGDSGWYVGPVGGPDGQPGVEDLEAWYVFQLLAVRPALLDVFMLPEGYLVVFDGERIDSVVDPDNHDVWDS